MNSRQELRKNKLQWNLQVSDFIRKLIAVKRGFNGRGTPELGIPDSSIKEPLSDKLVSILHELSQNFQHLSSTADELVTEQSIYSQQFQKEASWLGSRLVARTKWLAQLSKEDRKLRVRLLYEAYDFEKLIEQTRRSLFSSKLENVPKSITLVTLLGKQWINSLLPSINNILKNPPKIKKQDIEEDGLQVETIKNDIDSLAQIIKKISDSGKNKAELEEIKKSFEHLFELLAIWNNLSTSETPDVFKLDALKEDIKKYYHQLINLLKDILGEGNIATWLSESKKSSFNFKEIEKYARKGLIDWAREKWMDINPKLIERQSLDIVDSLSLLDDLLEKHLDLMEKSDYNLFEELYKESGQLVLQVLNLTYSLAHSVQLLMRRLPQEQRKSNVILTELDFRELKMTIAEVKKTIL